jgi:hypothetical protein
MFDFGYSVLTGFLGIKNRSSTAARVRLGQPFGSCRPQVEALEERLLMSVNVASKFRGIFNDDLPIVQGSASPSLAAGPNFLVETAGLSIAFVSKTTGNKVTEKSLLDFFSPLKPQGAANSLNAYSFNSPTVTYDEDYQRFVIVIPENYTADTNPAGHVGVSYLDVAVSKTADPTGGWVYGKVALDAPGSTALAFDPKIGWNKDAVVVSLFMGNTNGNTGFNQLVAFDWSTLTNSNPLTWKYYPSTPHNANFLVPATMHGSAAGGPMYLGDSIMGGTVPEAVTMTHVLSFSPNFAGVAYIYAGRPIAAAVDAPQLGGPNLRVTSDIMDVAWRNNKLVMTWTALENEQAAGSLDAAFWVEFGTSKAISFIQAGSVARAGAYIYNPAIEIDPNGDVGMTFMESSATQYISMFVAGQLAANLSHGMENPVLTQLGQAPYGYTGFSAGFFYAGISVDPVTGTFWAANMFKPAAGSPFNWGTGIANFSV